MGLVIKAALGALVVLLIGVLAKTKNYYICELKRCFEKLAYSLEIFQEISKPYGAGYV